MMGNALWDANGEETGRGRVNGEAATFPLKEGLQRPPHEDDGVGKRGRGCVLNASRMRGQEEEVAGLPL